MGNNILQDTDSDTNSKNEDEEKAGSDEDCKRETMNEILLHIQLLYSNS